MWQATTRHKYWHKRITTNLPAQPALITVMVCFKNHVPICDLKALRLSHWFYRKRVLKRYGHITDTTYKTPPVWPSLYFIWVKTNVGYIVVAEYVVQSEESEKIQEAAEVLKEWNPSWNLKFSCMITLRPSSLLWNQAFLEWRCTSVIFTGSNLGGMGEKWQTCTYKGREGESP